MADDDTMHGPMDDLKVAVEVEPAVLAGNIQGGPGVPVAATGRCGLSGNSWCYLASFAIYLGIRLFIAHDRMLAVGALFLLYALFTIPLVYWLRKSPDVSNDKVIAGFGKGFWVALPVTVCQYVCVVIVLIVVDIVAYVEAGGDITIDYSDVYGEWDYYDASSEIEEYERRFDFNFAMAMIVTSFFVFALPEEFIKLGITSRLPKCCYAHGDQATTVPSKTTTMSTTAFSLAFGLQQSYCVVTGLGATYLRFDDALILSLACLLFFLPVHVLSGYIIGLKVAVANRQERELAGCFCCPANDCGRSCYCNPGCLLAVPVIGRGIFYSVVLAVIVIMNTVVAWALVTVATGLVICAIMLWYAKRTERQLPLQYLQHVGYLSALGYGQLMGDEPEEGVSIQ